MVEPALVAAPSSAKQRRDAAASALLRSAWATTDSRERSRLHAEVAELYVEVAESISSRYRRRGVASEDLAQIAYLGLMKAVHGFDPTAGYDFLTYAVPTIRGEVRRYFRDHAWAVRPPRRLQEMQARISSTNESLHQLLGRSPNPQEVAVELDVDVEDVLEAMSANGCFTPTSLDAPASVDSSWSLSELLADDERDTQAAEARVVLGPALAGLSDRDRRILYLRFYDQKTQREIAEELGVTQMQISRLLSRILRDLRGAIGPVADSA